MGGIASDRRRSLIAVRSTLQRTSLKLNMSVSRTGGSDKEAILDLITSRSNHQRNQITQAYKSLYGKGIGTDEKCPHEILASRTNSRSMPYGRDLETDVVQDTSGHFRKWDQRREDDVVSEELVEQDATKQKWGTDEAQFIYVLGSRSTSPSVRYQEIAGKSIEDSIKGELSGDFQDLMLAVVKCIRSIRDYFATRLYKSMKGMGTADNTLIRIMVSRSEIDMMDIRESFRTKYQKSLYSMIKNDTSGEYKKALLKLCGGDDDTAGEFFPEAAQAAYQNWELSATVAKRTELKGTVQPADNFQADNDGKALRKAMKGFGTDEDTIIDIITKRSNPQRQEILKAFKSHFGRDLMADLKSELSGTLSKVILGLMMTPAQFDAKQLNKAMAGAGTDEKVLIEILATRNNKEIEAINTAYMEAFHKSLEDAISSDTSGHLKRILTSLALGNRDEGAEDLDKAIDDAKEMSDSGSGDSSSLETRFMTVLCTRSYPHLRRVFQEFIKQTNHDVEHIIKKEMSGDVKDAFVAIAFFAERLYKAMKDLVSRSETDLFNIRQEFRICMRNLYIIMSETSGDYRKALLSICGGDD
ncbi:hypothetical protein GDO86_005202 [Hymenochirus boettgeri]|uniref:Annexin n=1 Tax=Hymenochirus boettgeri TaxID=247094 RepID=A0A8T2J908_9PIPI|nr:hypothetical protein GDO86_005202 [Hymenochirus boettgeri]